jgi:hypothetical protein
LAIGEARENAPFVVGKVAFTSSKNLSTEDDENDRHGDDENDRKGSGKKHD